MKRRLSTLLALCAVGPAAALAQSEATEPKADVPRLGLDPGQPHTRSAPPSVPFGVDPSQSNENVFDFHGYMLLPLNVASHQRENPLPGQSETVLHTPPLIPQNYRSFEYTGVVPQTWVQLNFTYGNRLLSGTTIVAARSLTDASGMFYPPEQLGATDAFLRLNLSDPVGTPIELRLGAATGRYGIMGAYDLGRYATPVIARTNAIGENVTVAFDLGSAARLTLEHGFGGMLGRPDYIVPAGWNDFAFEGVGASFVHHWHAGFEYDRLVQVAAHYFGAFTRDDSATTNSKPDGSIDVLGVEARLTAGRAGHLYAGFSHALATDAETVSGVIEVLNARGGPELIEEYLGPNSDGGNGSVSTLAVQYDLSVARAVYGDRFLGQSPDVLVSLFGMQSQVASEDSDYDGITKRKLGLEATYTMLSWFGASARFDHVAPNADNTRESFNVISPRLLFHTDWQANNQFALQYSHYMYGGDVVVETGFPPEDDPSANPDADVLSLSGSFWW
jgi:hypothetical protein